MVGTAVGGRRRRRLAGGEIYAQEIFQIILASDGPFEIILGQDTVYRAEEVGHQVVGPVHVDCGDTVAVFGVVCVQGRGEGGIHEAVDPLVGMRNVRQ